MGVGVKEWGVTRWEQVIIMGQRVRVSLRIGGQGKNISWNIITMGTSVGSHKSAPQEENNCHKEAWVWEGGTWPCPWPYS